MFEHELKIYEFNLGYLETLVADIDEADFDFQPLPGMNTPRWILAHLAISTDYALRVLGEPTALPDTWHAGYGPGSSPNNENSPRPIKEELVAAQHEGHGRVVEAISRAEVEFISTPHEIELLRMKEVFPTRGELLTMLLTAHESLHIGQLTAWRRGRGWKPLF